MKAATIALIVRSSQNTGPEIVDILSDEREISLLESAAEAGEQDVLQRVYDFRSTQTREDDEFADYVEELLSQPFLKLEVQEHGVQWLRSKIRISQYERSENEAAKVIAKYALRIFSENPSRLDFLLSGPHAHVRVRVFVMGAIELPQIA